MLPNDWKKPKYVWNRAARIINRIGQQLQQQLGDFPIETRQIDDKMIGQGYRYHSVPPSDYCYNLINKGSSSFRYPIFEWIKSGLYRYLGPGFNYSGHIFWKGRPVGEWISGAYVLWEDPREKSGG